MDSEMKNALEEVKPEVKRRGRPAKLLSTQEACTWLGIGEDKFRNLCKTYEVIPLVAEGGKKLYTLAQLRELKDSI